METALTAVISTLLGSVATHFSQHRTTGEAERSLGSEEAREAVRECIAAAAPGGR